MTSKVRVTYIQVSWGINVEGESYKKGPRENPPKLTPTAHSTIQG